MLGGSLPPQAPRPHAEPRAHSNDEDVTTVKGASVDHLKDMGAGDDREQDASGNEIGSHQLPLGCREMMWALPPNGSRLSCGASAGGRKRPHHFSAPERQLMRTYLIT